MLLQSAVACLALLALTAATDVTQCPSKSRNEYNVELIPCKKLPCRLKKGTNQQIKITFTPENDLTEVKNHVTAEVFGVNLPFVGVDGSTICDKLTQPSGEPASCPLKAGTTYVYKDSFPILNFYPSIDVIVHWSIGNVNDKFVCFTVPARISK